MQEFLQKVPDLIQIIALLGMAVSVLATVIVRLTPSKVDDEKVGVVVAKLLKVLHWLPTIGINPQTKKLEEAYEELKAKEEVGPKKPSLLEILSTIVAVIREFFRLKRVGELKDAKNESLEEGDQRKLENELGGSSGPSSDDKYPGLYTRDRKRKNEIWLVDGTDMVLYRVISDTKEQAIPIKNNPAMKRFMCIDKDEADYWIEGEVE